MKFGDEEADREKDLHSDLSQEQPVTSEGSQDLTKLNSQPVSSTSVSLGPGPGGGGGGETRK